MEWKTGVRSEGVVYSLLNFSGKFSDAAQVLIQGIILNALHFDQNLEGIAGQPAEFYTWQWPLFILGLAIGALLSIIPLLLLKYTPAERKKVETELAAKRAANNAGQTETVEQ